MALYWVIDSGSRRVTVTATGCVGHAEMTECLAVIAGARASSYGKIFDGTAGKIVMGKNDMLDLAVTYRTLHGEPQAPLAIVLPAEKQTQLLPIVGILAVASRPLRFFTTRTTAERWMDSVLKVQQKP